MFFHQIYNHTIQMFPHSNIYKTNIVISHFMRDKIKHTLGISHLVHFSFSSQHTKLCYCTNKKVVLQQKKKPKIKTQLIFNAQTLNLYIAGKKK